MSEGPRVALVTGGMGGLGEAICIKLAALGYTFAATKYVSNVAINGGTGAITVTAPSSTAGSTTSALPEFAFTACGTSYTNANGVWYKYVGNDRINDANQITLALTSRLLDPDTGEYAWVFRVSRIQGR